MKNKKPPKCCHPNCTECPYVDCRFDGMTTYDYTVTNKRDYEHYEAYTGHKLHRPADKQYRNARHTAYEREHRVKRNNKEYHRQYYKENAEAIKERTKANYDTVTNTKKCRKWRKKNEEHRKEYEKEYYQKNREKKLQAARERYQRKKEADKD